MATSKPNDLINPILKNFTKKFNFEKIAERLGNDDAKALYYLAYEFYQNGNYIEAKNIFLYLLVCTEFDTKNLMGFAACFHAEKKYLTAFSIYRVCVESGLRHPLIYFHISDCLIHFGKRKEAITELRKVLEHAYGSTEFLELQTKASGMIALLEKNTGHQPL